MLFEQLCRDCNLYPFTPDTKILISGYLGLSVRQVERYIQGAKMHPSVVRLLEIKASGLTLDTWQGFCVQNDHLVTPSGEYWNKSDLENLSLTMQLVRNTLLKTRKRRAKKKTAI